MADIIPTQEEQRLLDLLTPEWWNTHATKRAIQGTSIGKASLTASGIVCGLSLVGSVTRKEIMSERGVDRFRLLLDVEDGHFLSVLSAGRETALELVIRTRSVTDTIDMHWHPGITSIGIDTVTGEEIHVPDETHILVSGMTGSGKSWAARPVIAAKALDPNWDILFVDPKGDEANIIRHVAETATTPYEIADMFDEADGIFQRNTAIMKRAGVNSWNDSLGKRTLLVVDEGREALNHLTSMDELRKAAAKEADEYNPLDANLRRMAVNLSAMARTKGIILLWETQYPIVSENKAGSGGLDRGINPNLDFRFSLRVAKRDHAQTAMGDADMYPAHKIPASLRGHGYWMDPTRQPNLIRTWTVPNEMIENFKSVTGAVPDGGFTPYGAVVMALSQGGLWTPDRLVGESGCGTRQAQLLLDTLVRNGDAVREDGAYRRL